MSSSSFNDDSNIFTGNLILKSQEIPFAYFSHDCSMEEFLNVMIKEWKVNLPKIMLFIQSDNTSKGWESYQEQENFMKGLIKGSNATSMWIFTSGLNIGISKAIGDAFEEDYIMRNSRICSQHSKAKTAPKLPLIGLCTDTMLTYHGQFETPEKVMHLENEGNIVEEQKFNLNPYHTNFLIIRDTTVQYNNCAREFFLSLARTLCTAKDSEFSMDDSSIFPKSPIPIVCILIHGDPNSIHYILDHLRQHLPVLVVRGSGGLADVIAHAYYETRRCSQKIKDRDYVNTVFRRGLNNKITSIFPAFKDNKMGRNNLCERILECLDCSEPPEMKYITVLNVADLTCNMENLPYYLLKVLFKSRHKEALSKHDRLTKDLQLTLDWNCPEIALTKVFYKDPTFKIDKDIFERALLQKGREAFVSLFLGNGFEVHKYLDANMLIKLFQHTLKETFLEVCWEGILGNREVVKLDKSFIDSDLNWIIESLTGISINVKADELNNASKEIFDEKISKDISIEIAKQRALMMLTLWALFSKQAELAMILWRHTDHPIMTALAASLVLEKMKPLISEIKTKEDFANLSQKFASMAVGVFDLCYNDLPSKAYDSLNIRMEEWAGLSVIDLAALSHNRIFVAHPCCQKWLTTKFMGNIKFRELSWGIITFPVYIKVILCAFFVFPMYLWVRFKESSIEEFVESDEYEKSDPYYIPEATETKHRVTKDDIGRSHLLKYQYPPLWQMIYYMWSAPITKFWVSNIFYVMYLVVFSLAVLWPSCGNVYLDSIVCAWTLLIAVDSTYRAYSIYEAFPYTPCFGSCLEITYIVFFVLFYFLLRVINTEEFRDPYTGKILGCLALIYFYYRMIFIYLPISSTLGPLLHRVKPMITVDFVNFMKLVMFILMGNAIAIQAILYPDFPLIAELIRMSFHKAAVIFFITPVGELSKTSPYCVTWEQKPATDTMCRVSDFVDGTCSDGIRFCPYVIVFQFVLLMKLVLMTVLFALFNATGARIGAESDLIWKFQRYNLIINFSNSLRLPPPLNVFSVLIIIYKFLRRCCTKGVSFLRQERKSESTEEKNLLESDSYWRQLANDYHTSEMREEEEEDYVKKELDVLSQLCDDLQMKEKLVYRTTAQIKQLESDIVYTHADIETLKYRAEKEDATEIYLHSLSRESPYPETNIHRFLVPDKYVPWEVSWVHYAPTKKGTPRYAWWYTKPKKDFPEFLQPYVDDEITEETEKDSKKGDRSSFNWHVGNRMSWIQDCNDIPLTYKLDKFDLPRNPMGRTGLRGKGALPRWGPNHNVFVVITRQKNKPSEKNVGDLMDRTDHYEYVEMFFMKKKDVSLPGGLVNSENKYEVVQSCFQMSDNPEPWQTSDEMISFFKDCAVGLPTDESKDEIELTDEEFLSNMVCCGYMDDQLNTDQAWKEVELWHIRYNVFDNLFRKFKANIHWKVLSEDVFTKLPPGQTLLVQKALKL